MIPKSEAIALIAFASLCVVGIIICNVPTKSRTRSLKSKNVANKGESVIPKSEAIALIALAALCVIGIIICAALQVDIPSILGDLALVGAGGGAGVARNTVVTTKVPS